MSDFDTFWSQYPRRQDRLAAMKEYIHARRLVSAETILQGLARYNAHLPENPNHIQKPATWLRVGAWDNEYDAPTAPPSYSMSDDWFHECQDRHQGSCGGSLKHYHRMQIERDRAKKAGA